MRLVILLTFCLLIGCHPVKAPPLLPLTPCIPSVKPKSPPCDPCPIHPIPGEPSSLSELVDIALLNHPLTKEAWGLSRSASAAVTISESTYYPTIELDVEGTRQHFSAFANIGANGGGTNLQPNGTLTYYDVVLSLTYLLWDFGDGRYNTVMSAKESLCASAWNYSWTIQSVMINVVSSYWNTIGATANLTAAESDLKDAQTLLNVSIAKQKAGLATHVDVAQAQANFVKAELNLVSAQGDLANAKASLATSVGLEPTTELPIYKPTPIEPTVLSKDLDRLVSKAKCCRADLTALKAAIKAQAYTVAVQKSHLYPTLNFGSYGARVWYLNPNSVGNDYSATIDLNYQLFSGFSTIGAIKQAEAQLDMLVAHYKNQELTALLNVSNSYTATKTALESYGYSKEYLIWAQDSFDSNLTGYKNGTRSIVDVINAEATLSDARSQLVNSETNYFTSLATLAYSTGLLVSQEVAQ